MYKAIGTYIAVGVAFVIVMLSENAWLVTPLSIALLAIVVWGFIEIRRSLHIDERVKRNAWVILFPIFYLIVKIGYVLHLV